MKKLSNEVRKVCHTAEIEDFWCPENPKDFHDFQRK